MMSLMSRTSRRNALVGFLAGSFLIVVILVLRDLNTKLDVMTQSNQRYQDMTDKQIEKIKSLQVSHHTVYTFKPQSSEYFKLKIEIVERRAREARNRGSEIKDRRDRSEEVIAEKDQRCQEAD